MKNAVLRPDLEFCAYKKKYLNTEKKRSWRRVGKAKYLNLLGIVFKLLREGDSFRRFDREVFAAQEDGLNVGDINHGRAFAYCALDNLENLIEEKIRNVFTNLDPATQQQSEIWIFFDG